VAGTLGQREKWTRLAACGECPRCDHPTPEDVEVARLAVKALWRSFAALPLEYTDPEVRMMVKRARWKRDRERRKAAVNQ
jgi:hypothetical protein